MIKLVKTNIMRYLLITLTICIGLMLGCNSKNNSKTEVVTSEEIIAEAIEKKENK